LQKTDQGEIHAPFTNYYSASSEEDEDDEDFENYQQAKERLTTVNPGDFVRKEEEVESGEDVIVSPEKGILPKINSLGEIDTKEIESIIEKKLA
jgi:hypothetical protein